MTFMNKDIQIFLKTANLNIEIYKISQKKTLQKNCLTS